MVNSKPLLQHTHQYPIRYQNRRALWNHTKLHAEFHRQIPSAIAANILLTPDALLGSGISIHFFSCVLF